MQTTGSFTKRKAVITILVFAAVILLLIGIKTLCSKPGGGDDFSTLDGRESFLKSFGWEIDRSSEEYHTVVIPDSLDGIMAQYNRMQQAQGYDLSKHLGESCQQYTYKLTNYSGSNETVLVTLYIQNNDVIAADIHTTSKNGFMHGLKTGN